MPKNGTQALFIMLILGLQLMVVSGSMSVNTISDSQAQNESFLLSETYSEDFTTTTYRDDGETTARGWGGGSVALQRDYSIELLDYYEITAGPVKSLDVQGRKAYVTAHNTSTATGSLRILDISDPNNILMTDDRGSSTLIGSCAVDGDIVAVGTDNGWVGLYNVSDPTNIPFPVSQVNLDGNVTSLEFEGKFLYVGLYGSSSGKGLLTFDIEDPSNPIKIENAYIFSKVLGVEVRDQIAFVADDSWGMFIENLTNPYNIQLIKQVDTTTGNTTDVLVDGGYAYLADGVDGARIVDIQDFTASSITGSYDTDGYAQRLAKQGDTLFVADGDNGVVILDVADPENPVYVDRIDLPYTWDVDMYGENLLVSTDDGVYSYKVSTVASIPQVGIYDEYDAKDVVVQGDLAYVAAGVDGLLTIDVSNPTNPVLLDKYNHSNSVNYVSVDVQGYHVYVTSVGGSLAGLLSFDVSDPSAIKYLNRVIFSYGYDVCVAGDLAVIADGTLGMYLLNISDPTSMGPNIDVMHDIDNYTAVDIQGHFIYTVGTGSTHGFYVYDATDLHNLVITDTRTLVSLSDVRVEGDYAFLADGSSGGYLYNVTDPHIIPGPLDYYNPLNNVTYGIDIVGRYMLMAERTGGVHLLNASNPSDLQLIASYTSPTIDALRVTVAGDFAYVAAGNSLVILHLFNSAGATYETSNVARSLEIDTTTQLIENATLTYSSQISAGSNITWALSADGGAHWMTAFHGIEIAFDYPGTDLRWRATLAAPTGTVSPVIDSLQIDYEVNALPTAPELNDLGTTDDDGDITVNWNASTDDGAIDHYILEMSLVSNFSTVILNWTPTTISQDITGLNNGTHYFRVRAVDDDGALSDWSSTESVDVEIPAQTSTTDTNTGPFALPVDGTTLIIIIAAVLGIVVIIIILKRRK